MENYELLAKRSKKLGIIGFVILFSALFLEMITSFLMAASAWFGNNARFWHDFSSTVLLILLVTAFPAALVLGIISIKTAKKSQTASQGNTRHKAAAAGLGFGIADVALASIGMLIHILGLIIMWVTFYVIGS
ncbi:MAG: hypothetical protein LBS74_07215 [Oscillospiraceae bacterium]|jgi:hypothetical protein|nr:hypothetical protein [Oscillospiraceae bacterium]